MSLLKPKSQQDGQRNILKRLALSDSIQSEVRLDPGTHQPSNQLDFDRENIALNHRIRRLQFHDIHGEITP